MKGQQRERQVVMPKLGMTMKEARILEWHREDGDRVEQGEVLFTIESEKAALDIEAPASGTLKIVVPSGETVGILEPVAKLLQVEEQASACAGEQVEVPRLVPASPKARAMAADEGLPLAEIEGTGPRGMVVVADVQRSREHSETARQAVSISPVARRVAQRAGLDDLSDVAGTGPGGRIMRHDVERSLAEAPAPKAEREGPVEVRPLAGPRAVTAERLSASWRERPHVTLTTEADASNLVSAREQLIADRDRKVSYNAFLVMAVARALSEHPCMNARFTEQGVEQLPQVDVGVAVDTERGLLVPVLRDPGSRDLLELDQALRGLLQRAQEGSSPPDELTGGTFTITNLGMYDIDAFTPIINPPESAILGVGRIVAKPMAVDREVVVRDRMALSLSFDHRVVDGAPAARFLQRVKQLIERPFALVASRSI